MIEPEDIPVPKVGDTLLKSDVDWWHNAYFEAPSMNTLAYAYSAACDSIVKAAQEGEKQQDLLVYPLLFVFRHYIELRLKHIIFLGYMIKRSTQNPPQKHELNQLWELAKNAIKQVWRTSADNEIKATESCINELVLIDNTSMSFRYDKDSRGNHLIDKNMLANLRNFKRVKEGIASFLDGVDEGMIQHLEMLEDMKRELGQGYF